MVQAKELNLNDIRMGLSSNAEVYRREGGRSEEFADTGKGVQKSQSFADVI